jgi:hypothetical protein
VFKLFIGPEALSSTLPPHAIQTSVYWWS